MKYLKSFESSKERYYWEISYPEFDKSDDIDISQEALDIIKKYNIIGKVIYTTFGLRTSSLDYKRNIFYTPIGIISESEDEWFKVSFVFNGNLKYYLCDQLEGLEECLKYITSLSDRSTGWIGKDKN